MDTLEELLNKIPRGVIVIIPNRDLPSPDYPMTNNANIDISYENSLEDIEGLGSRNRRIIRIRESVETHTQSDSRLQNNDESSDNFQDF